MYWPLLAAVLGTVGLVLLACQIEEIGERIPLMFVSLWVGSATIAGLVFSPGAVALPPAAPPLEPFAAGGVTVQQLWALELRRTCAWLLPLTPAPLLEIHRSGYDPALWLINGALVVPACSVPYFRLLGGSVVGGVVLNIGCLSLLWLPFVTWFSGVIERSRKGGIGSTADPFALHAFLAPEFRYLFYTLCGMILLVYCPIMFVLGRRRFVREMGRRHSRFASIKECSV